MMRGFAVSPCALQENIPVLHATAYVTQTHVFLRAVDTVVLLAWIATFQIVPVGFAQESIFGRKDTMTGNVCREGGFATVLLLVLKDAMTAQQTAIQSQAAMS